MRALHFFCLAALVMSSIGSAACRSGPALPASESNSPQASAEERRADESSAVHEEDPIEAGVVLTEELAAALMMHGEDCEKTADSLEEFAARNAERVKRLKGLSSIPVEMNSDQRGRTDEAMKAVGQVASECRSNPKFAAIFGTLVTTQTEKPPLKQ